MVEIADGEYVLEDTLVFSPQDSGTESFPVVYQAAPGANPVFHGGRRIRGFSPEGNGVWAVTLPEVENGSWYFEQLWINQRRATRARTPNRGFFRVANPAEGLNAAWDVASEPSSKEAFFAWPPDLQELQRIPAALLNDVNLVAFHAWETSRHRVSSVNPVSGLVTLTGPAPWPFQKWDINQRYYVENFEGALDAEGEWFLSRTGKLLYRPLPNEDLRQAKVVAPHSLERFVHFAGQPDRNRNVKYITLRGLSFQFGQYILPPQGHADVQAEVSISAAILVEGGEGIAIEDCEVAHIGTHAVWFRRGSRDGRVVGCFLHDLGAGGVRVGDGLDEDLTDPRLATENILVENTVMHGGGRIHHGAPGIWIGRSGQNNILHNDISDFFYTGVSVGWSWGYGVSPAVRNIIAYNHIHHLGQGLLDDLGGIYTLGVSPGTKIHNNIIHDIFSYSYGGWGIYADEGSSQIEITYNLVYDTQSGGFHQHYGKENLILNNIFCYGRDAQIQRSRTELNLAFVFSQNIVCWDEGPLAPWGSIKDAKVQFDHNLYWQNQGEVIDFQGQRLAERQAAGLDRGSIIADPRFIDSEGRNFRLQANSPALDLGFKPIDMSRVGVHGEMLAIIASLEMPQFRTVTPFSLRDDFNSSLPGTPPAHTRRATEHRPDLIEVQRSIRYPDRLHVLAVTDIAGLKYAYNPHFYYVPRHRDGVTTVSFDMLIESDVAMYHEWRDNRDPYRVGPRFSIRNGNLTAAGKSLMTVPLNRWMNFKLVAGLGGEASGTWDLVVTPLDGAPRVFSGLANGSPDWQALDWLGFSSVAERPSRFFLDNLEFRNVFRPPGQDRSSP